MDIGLSIKKIRELKNFTQQYMAAELNLSLSGYGKIERNESDLTIKRLRNIAQILGVEIDFIINFNQQEILNPSLTKNNTQLNGVSSNNDDFRVHLFDIIKEENQYLRSLVNQLAKSYKQGE